MNTPQQLRVLIAEDESLVATVIQCGLEMLGHEVIGRACDGRQVVEMAQTLHPDLILMDITMPEIDGLEATRLIQQQCPCPVILLTAHDDSDLVRRASEVGAAAYLVKPVQSKELTRTITIAMARFSDWKELRRVNEELRTALAAVKTLSGLLPICSYCKKIRNDKGNWVQIESYIMSRTEAMFSHGYCPECLKKYFPGVEP